MPLASARQWDPRSELPGFDPSPLIIIITNIMLDFGCRLTPLSTNTTRIDHNVLYF